MIQPIILAAGKGTRMRSERPKTLYEIAGKPMLQHILDAVAGVPQCLPPIIVVGHGKEEIISYVAGKYTCVEQKELSGTASAVAAALPTVPKEAEAVMVLYGDHPFIRSESIQTLADIFLQQRPTLVQSFLTVPDFTDEHEIFTAFGRLVRDPQGNLQHIVEYKNATEEERAIKEVNTGICVIDVAWLQEALPKIEANPVTNEMYLTDLVALACAEGKNIATVEVARQDALGINSPEDAERAQSLLQLES